KKAEIEQQLAGGQAQPQLQKLVETLRDQAFNAEGLADLAKAHQLSLKESDWIDRKSTDPLFGDARVQAAAFGSEVLKDGNNSDVIELAPDHYILLRRRQHEPAAPRPLADVRAQIVAALTQERAQAAATEQAQ